MPAGGCPICSNQGTAEIPLVYSLTVSSPLSERRGVFPVDTGFKRGKSMSGCNFDAFSNAQVVLQRRDYESWKETIDALLDRNVGKEH